MSWYAYQPAPYGAPAYGPPSAAPWPQSQSQPQQQPQGPQQPPPASKLAWAGVIIAGVALFAAVVGIVLAVVLTGGSFDEGGGFGGPLTGRLEQAPSGELSGLTLQSAVSKVILEDGGDVTQLTCPATPRVAQGVFSVCHATITDEPWAVVVLFEDTDGSFTLDLI